LQCQTLQDLTTSQFNRYNITSEDDLSDAAQKLDAHLSKPAPAPQPEQQASVPVPETIN
jgi:hypothetical protein